MVTQPLMYRHIRDLTGARSLYADLLTSWKVLEPGEPDRMVETFRQELDKPLGEPERPYTPYVADWRPFRDVDWRTPADTAIPLSRLRELGESLTHIPDGFVLHPRVIMVMSSRRQMVAGGLPVDWGMAEALAYAGLLTGGNGVRVSGQDAGRGTFFHRHAVLHDQNRQRWDDGTYIPLRNLAPDQANFLVIDSVLSEEAVLAFEYGYASTAPHELVIWEAQFGDFANGAQVVIDQFIAAAETKWGRLNGLTMFLPHGYEGQGPEHSSGRIERFLQLAAQDNFQIVQPSTAAQHFHLLRRQVLRPYRKPLIVFTPKSLLRHPDSASPMAELAEGRFHPVLAETDAGIDRQAVTRLVFCSGRVYYDLLARRKERGHRHVAFVRIEQMYPFPDVEVSEVLAGYPKVREIVWAQDEPRNQGPWRFMAHELGKVLQSASDLTIRYAGRPESASPATGFHSLHKAQLEAILATALD